MAAPRKLRDPDINVETLTVSTPSGLREARVVWRIEAQVVMSVMRNGVCIKRGETYSDRGGALLNCLPAAIVIVGKTADAYSCGPASRTLLDYEICLMAQGWRVPSLKLGNTVRDMPKDWAREDGSLLAPVEVGNCVSVWQSRSTAAENTTLAAQFVKSTRSVPIPMDIPEAGPVPGL